MINSVPRMHWNKELSDVLKLNYWRILKTSRKHGLVILNSKAANFSDSIWWRPSIVFCIYVKVDRGSLYTKPSKRQWRYGCVKYLCEFCLNIAIQLFIFFKQIYKQYNILLRFKMRFLVLRTDRADIAKIIILRKVLF